MPDKIDPDDDSWKSPEPTIGDAVVEDLFRGQTTKGNKNPTNKTPPPGGKRQK